MKKKCCRAYLSLISAGVTTYSLFAKDSTEETYISRYTSNDDHERLYLSWVNSQASDRAPRQPIRYFIPHDLRQSQYQDLIYGI